MSVSLFRLSSEFAVTTSDRISFYDHDWQPVTQAAHTFDDLSALAYDELDDTVYFSDKAHQNGSIFSLRLGDNHQQHRIAHLVDKAHSELIQSISFDPLDRMLYWTDAQNHHIRRAHVTARNATTIDVPEDVPTLSATASEVWISLDNSSTPHGIAIDACRRKVYWTNWSPKNGATIERASMDGSKHETIIASAMDMPLGIVVDQYAGRLFWVDDKQGIHYSVESAALDGTARRVLIRGLDHAPKSLAVDRDTVYWTDSQLQSVFRLAKSSENASDAGDPIHKYDATPNGIVVRDNLLSAQAQNEACALTVAAIKQRMVLVEAPAAAGSVGKPMVNGTKQMPATSALPFNFCLNNGVLNAVTNTCICANTHKGKFCELPVCHNYCVNGKCHVTAAGYAQCKCFNGYSGDRCERDVCSGFCLNGGRCTVEAEDDGGEPVCQCTESFGGRRCERMNEVEACRRYCELGEQLPGYQMKEMCGK